MKIKKGICTGIAAMVLYISGCSDSPNMPPLGTNNPDLASFDIIKNNYISDAEKKIGMINFNEFGRIYVYNYFSKKSATERQKALQQLQEDTSNLRYTTKISSERKPPVVMHWTDGDNAMGAIRTLFKQENNMAEGVIGVDYLVTEPLKHPDFPKRPAKSYIINFSRSDVATTWYHAAGTSEDRKYNKAINIEITGWRFLKNIKGKKANYGKQGSLGIREDFNGDYKNMDKKYAIYPTVLKLVNQLAEKHKFTSQISQFKAENEISKNLSKNGTVFLDGPLSKYIKGHGLIGLEYSMKYGGNYKDLRHDFTPKDLLVLYGDLKGYRQFLAKKPSIKA
jgi:hypothetical protein